MIGSIVLPRIKAKGKLVALSAIENGVCFLLAQRAVADGFSVNHQRVVLRVEHSLRPAYRAAEQ
jgi:hypothetical protein